MGFVTVDIKELSPVDEFRKELQARFDNIGVLRAVRSIPTETGYIEEGTYVWGISVMECDNSGACRLRIVQYGTDNTVYAVFPSFSLHDYFVEEPELTALTKDLDTRYKRVDRGHITCVALTMAITVLTYLFTLVFNLNLTRSTYGSDLFPNAWTLANFSILLCFIAITVILASKTIFRTVYRHSISGIRDKLNTKYGLCFDKRWLYKPLDLLFRNS